MRGEHQSTGLLVHVTRVNRKISSGRIVSDASGRVGGAAGARSLSFKGKILLVFRVYIP